MTPTDFPQSTRSLKRPDEMTAEQCSPLRVHWTGSAYVSCWRPSWRERLALLFGRPVWLWVLSTSHPPVALETADPFRVDK